MSPVGNSCVVFAEEHFLRNYCSVCILNLTQLRGHFAVGFVGSVSWKHDLSNRMKNVIRIRDTFVFTVASSSLTKQITFVVWQIRIERKPTHAIFVEKSL